MSTELRTLFHSRPTVESPQASLPTNTTTTAPGTSGTTTPTSSGTTRSSSMLTTASFLCDRIRPGKSHRKSYKPYKSPVGKEVQKSLVLIDFQGEQSSDVVPLKDYEKLYDGCIRYRSSMSEHQIRKEIVRLVRQKESITHALDRLAEDDFDFVRVANRRVRVIDGDAPFDANGIAHVYKNGAIYIRLNTQLLEHYTVSIHVSIILSVDIASADTGI